MGLTSTKEALLHRTNERQQNEHAEAVGHAARAGKQAPPAPVPLTPEQIEYPKWLHRGWKPSAKGDGHNEPAESKLVRSETEHRALGSDWTEEPPKKVEEKKK